MNRRSFLKTSLLGGVGAVSMTRREAGGAPPLSAQKASIPSTAPTDGRNGRDHKPLFTVGPFQKIYEPSPPWPVVEGSPVPSAEHWHVNDHCFARGRDGTWHMFGIVAVNPGFRARLSSMGHATAGKLTQKPWVTQKPPFQRDDEEVLWAPHIVSHQGVYHMFYCSGNRDRKRTSQEHNRQPYFISLRTSTDLWNWSPQVELWVETPQTGWARFQEGYQARDPMVLWNPAEQAWVMYYTVTENPDGGYHIVACRTSHDLVHWSGRSVAYRDSHVGTEFGPTESPFVVQRDGGFFLFIGPRPYDRKFPQGRNWEHPGYVGTDVFYSRRWNEWTDADYAGHIHGHALEVVQDENGKSYVSSAGIAQGGLFLAELHWIDE